MAGKGSQPGVAQLIADKGWWPLTIFGPDIESNPSPAFTDQMHLENSRTP